MRFWITVLGLVTVLSTVVYAGAMLPTGQYVQQVAGQEYPFETLHPGVTIPDWHGRDYVWHATPPPSDNGTYVTHGKNGSIIRTITFIPQNPLNPGAGGTYVATGVAGQGGGYRPGP